jgi:hypothetical protein
MRFTVTRQTGRSFLLRDRPETVDANEVTKTFEWIQLSGIVLHDEPYHCTASGAKRERQLVVRDRDDGTAVERAAIDGLR